MDLSLLFCLWPFHRNKASKIWEEKKKSSNYKCFKLIDKMCVLVQFIPAFGLRCWQCSNIQGYCGDPFHDEIVSAASFVDCSLRGNAFASQWTRPYNGNGNGNGQPWAQQQWRQPWAQPQQGPWGQQQQQWGAPVCVKSKSISKSMSMFGLNFISQTLYVWLPLS